MGDIRFLNNKILFAANQIAMDDACCTCPPDIHDCCGNDCDTLPRFLLVTIRDVINCGTSNPHGDCACELWVNDTFLLEWTGTSACFWSWVGETCQTNGVCRAPFVTARITGRMTIEARQIVGTTSCPNYSGQICEPCYFGFSGNYPSSPFCEKCDEFPIVDIPAFRTCGNLCGFAEFSDTGHEGFATVSIP